MADTKQCPRCKETKSFDAFHRRSNTKDGRQVYCKQCRATWDSCQDCGTGITRGALQCDRCRKTSARGEKSPRWSGGRSVRSGYVHLSGYRDHPNATPGGRIAEHTLVMSEHLGRPLLPGENVHHKNGDKQDNRIENLELWSSSQPPGQRVEDKVAWAREILAQYEPELKKLEEKNA